jgi:hypothetical protein
MAQTLTVQASIAENSATGGGFAGTRSLAVTTSGDAKYELKGYVNTTEEEWTITTEITDAGYCVVTNFDATNYVQVGFATTVYNIRLKPGQSAVFPLEPATASLVLKANVAPCVVRLTVYEA